MSVGEIERYRHLKRGTVYEVIGTAELQAGQPQLEHAELVIYRGEDGKLWARNSAEFHDGRFERVASTDMAGAGEGGVWDSYRLPCDVHLAPATIIKAGCQLATLKVAMEVPHRPKHFEGHPNDAFRSAAPPVEGLTSGERVQQIRNARAVLADILGVPVPDAFYMSDGVFDFDRAVKKVEALLAASPKATATASVREAHILTVAKAADYVVRFEAAVEQQKDDPSAALTYLASQAEVAVRYIKRLIALTDSGTAATIGGERA